ncbi:MAG: hypothetical protein MJ123_06500 [Lachnospiraceae bacterium]|nr:hypothetical protein [Lachnospiraceae bacterium]
MKNKKDEEYFENALKDKKIPILTLDNAWHRLFTQVETTPEIKESEKRLNELLMKQGKANSSIKDIKALKKKLMAEIVELMDEISGNPSKKSEAKLEKNKKLIEECNEKIEAFEDESLDLPKMINEENYKLMLLTMESCYEQIQDNNEEIEEISAWVDAIRVELKKKLVKKQTKINRNQQFYTYMHNIFGADVIDIFDMKYNINFEKQEALTPDKNTNVVIKDKAVKDEKDS